jgi:hypothetical protein
MRAKVMRLHDDSKYLEENGTIYYDKYYNKAKTLEDYFKGNMTIHEDEQEDYDDDGTQFITKKYPKRNSFAIKGLNTKTMKGQKIKRASKRFVTNAGEAGRRKALDKDKLLELFLAGNVIGNDFESDNSGSVISSPKSNTSVNVVKRFTVPVVPKLNRRFTMEIESVKDPNVITPRKIYTPRFSVKDI